jgi:thioredoxin-related protein
MKKLFIPFLLLALLVPALGQQPGQPSEKKGPEPQVAAVKWMTFEEALERSKTEKRKIFIDVYTDWCGWCKVMDKTTFSEENVAKILNDKFYPVKFNAEQRADVEFSGHTFKFIPSGNSGVHELAAALLKNQLSYPTVVFLDENFAMIQPLPGYQKAPEFHRIIQFIGEDYWKKMKWADFQGVYKSPYPETQGTGSGN